GGLGSLTSSFGSIVLTKRSNEDDIFIAKYGNENQIYTGSTGSNFFCTGRTFNLPFVKKGIFNVGNFFQAELSDSAGSFLTPLPLGSIVDTASGSISITIPSGVKPGNRYRVRVTSSSPSI